MSIKKSTSIFLCLWERANQRLFDQVSIEFTTQLIENQLKAIQELELGPLRDRLLTVIVKCLVETSNGRRMHPMDVMNSIGDAFGKLHMIKGSKKDNIVQMIVKGRLTTRMKNYNLDFSSELNPRQVGLEGVPREYDIWLFFRYSNKEIMQDMSSGTFLFPVVTIPKE